MVVRREGLERFASRLAGLGEAALAVFVPPLCVVCGGNLRCWESWLCQRCSLLVSMSAAPGTRRIDLGAPGSLQVSYGLEYTPWVSNLVREMKYGGRQGLAEFLGRFLWQGAGDLFSSGGRDCVLVPVPIHPRKRRERGYNQAEILCRRVSELSGIPIATSALAKRKDTPSQTTLRPAERTSNVVGTFEAGDLTQVWGRNVVLIDDVVTTGSTLKECAVTLSASGAKEIRACAVSSSG